jgi:hypothetical protein
MIECLILGDSIAVGLAQHKPECQVVAKGGISSGMFNVTYKGDFEMAQTAIISLGTNDYRQMRTKDELVKMRKRVIAGRVFWIEPIYSHPTIGRDAVELQNIIAEVAEMFGDRVVVITNSNDAVHPNKTGYLNIVEGVK